MKPFIHDDFLLPTASAQALFHQFAEHEPILDFHNHLSPKLIAENHRFADLAEIWLGGDHYKWRAMRASGVDESLITGKSSTAREKFQAWAETVPHTLGNPLYHWTHLELARDFEISALLNEKIAEEIWLSANEKLVTMKVHDILNKHDVRVLCTSDDPTDSLKHHEQVNSGDYGFKMYPTYRPDKAMAIADPAVFRQWISKLEEATGTTIRGMDELLSALKKTHDTFHEAGCRLSDHGLEHAPGKPASHDEAESVLKAVLSGNICNVTDHRAYASFLMLKFGHWDAERGWAKQLHLGAIRNTNQRMRVKLGADAGLDSIGDFPQAETLAAYLNALDETDQLPKTILYNVNPADNYVFGSMIGNFQDGTVPGKIQMGSGWWFLDQKEGMEWQLKSLGKSRLLSRFVGMVTDSRSFLSFPRHEYFRRVLCGWLGQGIEAGELPGDLEFVGGMVKNICFANARNYFRFPGLKP